jgi:hypothetical protein
VIFPLDILMVHSSTLVVIDDGEHLTYGGFSLGKIIRFENLEIITDCFGSLSLSPKQNDSGAIFVGMAHRGSPSLCIILEDFADELYIASIGEGSLGFPITTTPRPEDAPTP